MTLDVPKISNWVALFWSDFEWWIRSCKNSAAISRSSPSVKFCMLVINISAASVAMTPANWTLYTAAWSVQLVTVTVTVISPQLQIPVMFSCRSVDSCDGCYDIKELWIMTIKQKLATYSLYRQNLATCIIKSGPLV